MTGIDTNILIYACDKGIPVKQARAQEIIAGTADGVVFWQVACEFIAASRKLASQGFTATEAWARLSELLRFFPLLPVARDLHLAHQVSFWDATIIASCLQSGAKRLYSEDLPGGQIGGVEIIDPFA